MPLNPINADKEGRSDKAHARRPSSDQDTLGALLSIDKYNMFVALDTCSPQAQAIVRNWLPNLKDHSLIHVDHLQDSIEITKDGQVKINSKFSQHIEKGWDWAPNDLYVLSHTDAKKWFKTPKFDIHTVLYFYAIPPGYSITLQLYESDARNAAVKSAELITTNKEYVILPYQCYSIEVAALPSSTKRRTSSSQTRRSSRRGFVAGVKHSRHQKRLQRAEIKEQNKKLQNSLRYAVLYVESGEGVPVLDRSSYRLFPRV